MPIQIIYAGYGVWNNVNDSTVAIQNAYNEGKRSFKAENFWSGDPAPGQRKYLFIIWNDNGRMMSGVTGERDDNGIELP